MKVENYTHRGLTVADHRRRQAKGPVPPFKCPWATPPDNCPKVSDTAKEHSDHIRNVHELPGLKSRNIFGFDEGET